MSTRKKPSSHLHAVILAGGRGTRFWPRSRRRQPKQLMDLRGDASLLQQTVARLNPLIPPQNIWVFTNDYLTKEVIRQLPNVPQSQIVAEPVQRNTAPCVGLAAELISLKDPDAVLGVFPSDHVVEKPEAFREVAALAFQLAGQEKIVVLGIRPRWPETGYGYIEFAAPPRVNPPKGRAVKQFREKPGLAVAESYVEAKRFFWNSGMFFWKASVIKDCLHRFLPQTAEILASIATDVDGRDGRRFKRILNERYPECESISVDYAVLEKASNVMGIPCDIGWNDMGSWRAAYDLLKTADDVNVLRSEALLVDSSGLYIDAPNKLVAAIGIKDLVIVDTADALLIVPRERAQDVSRLVADLEKRGRDKLL